MDRTTKIVLLVVVGALALCGAAIGGTLFAALFTGGAFWKHEAEREEAALYAQRRATAQRLAAIRREFEEAKKKEEALKKRLASAKDEAERAKLEAALAVALKRRRAAGSLVRKGDTTP